MLIDSVTLTIEATCLEAEKVYTPHEAAKGVIVNPLDALRIQY